MKRLPACRSADPSSRFSACRSAAVSGTSCALPPAVIAVLPACHCLHLPSACRTNAPACVTPARLTYRVTCAPAVPFVTSAARSFWVTLPLPFACRFLRSTFCTGLPPLLCYLLRLGTFCLPAWVCLPFSGFSPPGFSDFPAPRLPGLLPSPALTPPPAPAACLPQHCRSRGCLPFTTVPAVPPAWTPHWLYLQCHEHCCLPPGSTASCRLPPPLPASVLWVPAKIATLLDTCGVLVLPAAGLVFWVCMPAWIFTSAAVGTCLLPGSPAVTCLLRLPFWVASRVLPVPLPGSVLTCLCVTVFLPACWVCVLPFYRSATCHLVPARFRFIPVCVYLPACRFRFLVCRFSTVLRYRFRFALPDVSAAVCVACTLCHLPAFSLAPTSSAA